MIGAGFRSAPRHDPPASSDPRRGYPITRHWPKPARRRATKRAQCRRYAGAGIRRRRRHFRLAGRRFHLDFPLDAGTSRSVPACVWRPAPPFAVNRRFASAASHQSCWRAQRRDRRRRPSSEIPALVERRPHGSAPPISRMYCASLRYGGARLQRRTEHSGRHRRKPDGDRRPAGGQGRLPRAPGQPLPHWRESVPAPDGAEPRSPRVRGLQRQRTDRRAETGTSATPHLHAAADDPARRK